MNQYETYIIAFLDILGFKNLINTSSFDKVLDIFKSILTDKDAITALWHAVEDDDSICYAIQELLLNLETPILLRGAIAVGDFYLNENLVFGKGLVDAYWAQERYAVYPRIIISNDITVGRRVSVDNGHDLPKDDDGYYYINCIERYLGEEHTWEEIENSEQYDKLKNMIDINLNGYNDDRVRQKYLWLERELERIKNRGYEPLLVKG